MSRGAKRYDVIVIGSGSGSMIAEEALGHGLKVALVDKGPLGGTCANVGCIPSKMLTVSANRIMEIREARKLGIVAEVREVDFGAIMERTRRQRAESQREMRGGLEHVPNLDFYELEGHFVAEHTLEVGEQRIQGDKIFIVAGARPSIPPINGLEQVDYLTNDNVFELEQRPDSMVIIGGGYIACEFAHFFSAVGTAVTLLQRNDRLAPEEEPEISELLRRKMAERMEVHTSTEVVGIRRTADGCVVIGRDRRTLAEREFAGQQLLVAAGRRSNADLLQVEKARIATDPRGYIVVNEYLQTNVPQVWALGDVIGKHMFKHVANREALLAWHNSHATRKTAMDYHATPHALFTYPEIASVGLTEAEARRKHKIMVGRANYSDVAYGDALVEDEGFAKAIAAADGGKILGFHVIGPYAAMVIQEIINAMSSEEAARGLAGLHIHPALSELVLRALNNLTGGG